ncbi:MAG: gamma-glutamylcyclotransferase family protein [Bacteroidota bacterium]
MAATPKHIFVYGTLRRGRPTLNGWQKKLGAEFVGHGSIRAGLYNVGRYPGALPSRTLRTYGEVFRLENPASALKQLDQYEEYDQRREAESLYIRRLVSVTLQNGKTVLAWVYYYNKVVPASRLIRSGKYRQRRKAV